MIINNDVWVVIPAYNEENKIKDVIDKTKEYVQNIVLVDDGSKDNTINIAKETGIKALRHVVNLGKGSALKTGCEFALRKEAKQLIAIDADGQHDPAEIPNFLEALKESDIVFGYRKLTKDMPFVLRFGNWFISRAVGLLFGINLRDTQSGYRAFSADTYKKIKWDAQDYYVESEMIANAGKNRLKYKEIPIQTIYSDKYKGTTIFDGMKIVLKMIWWKFMRW
ncbi:glycosyltransferase family 2 protein [Candidatus Woesearchaeota archaeon]|nr:glycosyltransferase family 2 protein [Candidatus Woesearchaeota archaeon]